MPRNVEPDLPSAPSVTRDDDCVTGSLQTGGWVYSGLSTHHWASLVVLRCFPSRWIVAVRCEKLQNFSRKLWDMHELEMKQYVCPEKLLQSQTIEIRTTYNCLDTIINTNRHERTIKRTSGGFKIKVCSTWLFLLQTEAERELHSVIRPFAIFSFSWTSAGCRVVQLRTLVCK